MRGWRRKSNGREAVKERYGYMQIQNDYNPHSGLNYEPAHTHHITKCLHEEEHIKQQTGAAGIKNKALSFDAAQEQKGLDGFYEYGSGIHREIGGGRGKPGVIREFWDSLGEEKEKGAENILAAWEKEKESSQMHTAGISAVSSAIRQIVPNFVITKVGNVREKIKAGIGAALKRFGKREDAFGALSNPGSYFGGKRKGKEEISEKTGKGTRRANQEIITATISDSHLMDSYSKTGRYCRLNENLIYQKNREDKEEKI